VGGPPGAGFGLSIFQPSDFQSPNWLRSPIPAWVPVFFLFLTVPLSPEPAVEFVRAAGVFLFRLLSRCCSLLVTFPAQMSCPPRIFLKTFSRADSKCRRCLFRRCLLFMRRCPRLFSPRAVRLQIIPLSERISPFFLRAYGRGNLFLPSLPRSSVGPSGAPFPSDSLSFLPRHSPQVSQSISLRRPAGSAVCAHEQTDLIFFSFVSPPTRTIAPFYQLRRVLFALHAPC